MKMKDKDDINILLTAVNARYIHSNLAVYTLQAYAEKFGIHTEIAEYTINQQFDEVLSDIYSRKPDVLCFSCYIWNIEYVKELITEFHKLCPGVPIWLGGPEVSFETEEFLRANPAVTGVIIGEGERTFSLLCGHYAGVPGAPDFNELPGIAWRDETGQIHTNEAAAPLSMDELPFCYSNPGKFENRIIYYESSRGCPFSCSYCLSSVDRHLRMRSLPLVYKELQFFLDNRVPQVKFVDRTFNCNHEHALGIWRYISEHDNGITNFHFEVAADLMNEEELKLLKSMRPGLIQLEIGVQSTNADTIREIHRSMDLKRLKEVVGCIGSGHNINRHLDLIAGLPYENYDSFTKSFDEIYRLKAEQLQLGFLKVLKGSYMYDMAENYGLLYRDRPAYEVMATKWLSYEELQRIKMVEEMLETYYNSGQFLRTLAVLESHFESPFGMFLGIAQYYKEHKLRNINHTHLARAEILHDFAVQEDPGHRELYGEAVIFDLYIRENAKARPSWAPDAADFGRLTGKMMHDKGYDHRYCHAEPFHYAVPDIDPHGLIEDADRIEYSENVNWYLFDYGNRNPLSREAELIHFTI